jgi:hypothetical protein
MLQLSRIDQVIRENTKRRKKMAGFWQRMFGGGHGMGCGMGGHRHGDQEVPEGEKKEKKQRPDEQHVHEQGKEKQSKHGCCS